MAVVLYNYSTQINQFTNNNLWKQALKRTLRIKMIQRNDFQKPEQYVRLTKEANIIAKDLARFTITNKSILMIVENALSNLETQQRVFRFVKQLFEDLDDDDFFGLIQLNQGEYSHTDIQLEKRSRNKIVKTELLR